MRWVVVAALVLSVGVGLADELPRDTNENKTLTVEQAKTLAKHGDIFFRQRFCFCGTSKRNVFTPEVAEALAKCEVSISLDGLTTITPEAAEALAKHNENDFDDLHEFSGLSLNGFTKITAEAAEALAKCECELSLDGLTTITPEVAEALAKHEGWGLSLDGLTTITPEVAEALAKHEGEWLSLDGLATKLRANTEIVLPDKFTE